LSTDTHTDKHSETYILLVSRVDNKQNCLYMMIFLLKPSKYPTDMNLTCVFYFLIYLYDRLI